MDLVVHKRIGEPRLDKTARLLHRFYEPLVLLRILEPTREGHTVLCKSDNLKMTRRKCLDHLSWICDYEPGGKTVTAIATEDTVDGIKYWLSTNEKPMKKSSVHLEWVLRELASAHLLSPGEIAELESKLIKRCIAFSVKKLKHYSRRMISFVRRTEQLLTTTGKVWHHLKYG